MIMKDVYDALVFGDKNGQSSKELFEEARDKQKLFEIKESAFHKKILDGIEKEAQKYLREPLKVLPYSLYKIYQKTGTRMEYEKEYFNKRKRLTTFAVMSLFYDKTEYISALEDAIWASCDEYTWTLPAHFHGKSTAIMENIDCYREEDGRVSRKQREHYIYTDLMAAETGFALAEIVSLLESKLSPLVTYRARSEIKRRVLEPFCTLNHFYPWEIYTNNWAAVCAGSIGAAAMYLIDDSAVLAPIIFKALGVMECFISGFGNDGACLEGLGYWGYGFGFYVYFTELLKQRSAGKINLMSGEKVKNIALFQQKCYISGDSILSFSDSKRKKKFILGLTHQLKRLYDEVKIPNSKYSNPLVDDTDGRWMQVVRDILWSSNKPENSNIVESFNYFESAQWFISRNLNKKGIVSFAAKGGHNDEPHNHNDIGNFILNVYGDDLISDLGAGTYTKQYFSTERYSIFCNGSQGHSVPIVEGEYQQPGIEYKAKSFNVTTSECEDVVNIDISGAYKSTNLKILDRNLIFQKLGQIRFILRDYFEFINKPVSICERFILTSKPNLVEDGKAVIPLGDSQVIMTFDSNKLSISIETTEFTGSGSIKPEEIYIIDLYLKDPDRKEFVEVCFNIRSN